MDFITFTSDSLNLINTENFSLNGTIGEPKNHTNGQKKKWQRM